MILSRSSQYGIELILYLANHPTEKFIPMNEVAKEKELSFFFLSKITQSLVQHDILKTYRGPNGGVTLNIPANELTLYDIVNAIEGNALFNKCILRPETCDETDPCPLHPAWGEVRDKIRDVFMNTTLDQVKENKSFFLNEEFLV